MSVPRHTTPTEPTVSCREIQTQLLQGALANAQVRAHLETCLPCAELAADQAELAHLLDRGAEDLPPLEKMMAATQQKIAADVGIAARIKHWSTPVRAGLMFSATAAILAFVLAFRARPDLAAVPIPDVSLRSAGLLLWVGIGLASAMRPSHIPALRTSGFWAMLGAAVVGPVVVALLPEMHTGHEASLVDNFALQTGLCFVWGTAVAFAVVALWRTVERRSQPTARHFATAAATAAAAANIALLLHCPLTDPAHMVVGHGLIGAFWAMGLWLFTRWRLAARP